VFCRETRLGWCQDSFTEVPRDKLETASLGTWNSLIDGMNAGRRAMKLLHPPANGHSQTKISPCLSGLLPRRESGRVFSRCLSRVWLRRFRLLATNRIGRDLAPTPAERKSQARLQRKPSISPECFRGDGCPRSQHTGGLHDGRGRRAETGKAESRKQKGSSDQPRRHRWCRKRLRVGHTMRGRPEVHSGYAPERKGSTSRLPPARLTESFVWTVAFS
jgi:hypothetical protein